MAQISWTGAIEIRKPIASIRNLRRVRLTLCSPQHDCLLTCPHWYFVSAAWEQYPSVD